jgi:hypothetical protein
MHIRLGDEINNKVVTNIAYQSTYPRSAGYSYNTKGNLSHRYAGHKNRVVVTLDDNTELTWNPWLFQFD